ncbi:MAG TPA: hypothetical protein DEO44_00230, partial [Verrucomicrobia subdivision 6 bacterium]|nr:hypothetical protein [Verrucomicrobia subdivision 6 bacterium]
MEVRPRALADAYFVELGAGLRSGADWASDFIKARWDLGRRWERSSKRERAVRRESSNPNVFRTA